MDAFGDDFSSVADVDPAAEFLAREQEALAVLDDDLLAESVEAAEPVAQSDGFPTDAFPTDAFAEQPSAFQAPEENMVNHAFDGFGGQALNSAPAPVPAQVFSNLPREEPEKILIWRQEQKLRLQLKDEEEERKKTEMKEQAHKELDDWYKHHKETIEKTRAANRNAEKDLVSTQVAEPEAGQEWERIAKLCDFNPKASRNSKDVSRMRSIILQLKQTPPMRSMAASAGSQ